MAARFAATWARTFGLADDRVARLELAVEEVVANIARHAYSDLGGPVTVEVRRKDGRVQVLVGDQGPPFDPVASGPPTLGDTLEERELGGLGIRMILSFVDDVRYERTSEGNVLVLTCNTGPAPGEHLP